MYDIQLDEKGELYIGDNDIRTTDSVKQDIRIHLQWFFKESIFEPSYGVKYFDYLFVKNPSERKVIGMLTREIMKVEGVGNVSDMSIKLNVKKRTATINFTVVLDSGERLRDEVKIWQNME